MKEAELFCSLSKDLPSATLPLDNVLIPMVRAAWIIWQIWFTVFHVHNNILQHLQHTPRPHFHFQEGVVEGSTRGEVC